MPVWGVGGGGDVLVLEGCVGTSIVSHDSISSLCAPICRALYQEFVLTSKNYIRIVTDIKGDWLVGAAEQQDVSLP